MKKFEREKRGAKIAEVMYRLGASFIDATEAVRARAQCQPK